VTVPSILVASAEYWYSQLLDWEIVWWSIGIGTPAIVAGSFLSHAVGARLLLIITGVLVLAFGISFLFFPRDLSLAKAASDNPKGRRPAHWRLRLVTVATRVGLISGLLANAGGFLLVPSYTQFLKQPMKKAIACSLAVSTVLAVPGTIVHASLGHISWVVTGLVALGAIPFSHLGARLAIATRAEKLERWYGLALTGLGIFLSFSTLIKSHGLPGVTQDWRIKTLFRFFDDFQNCLLDRSRNVSDAKVGGEQRGIRRPKAGLSSVITSDPSWIGKQTYALLQISARSLLPVTCVTVQRRHWNQTVGGVWFWSAFAASLRTRSDNATVTHQG